MTLQQALDRIDMIRPNKLDRVFKVSALSSLDGIIWREIITTHEMSDADTDEFTGYTQDTDPDTVLLAPEPYDDVYTYWLACRIDEQTLEIGKFNNDKVLFNSAYQMLDDYWTRTHMPLCRVKELSI